MTADMSEDRTAGHGPVTSTARMVRTRLVAELKCLMCGRPAGVLEGSQAGRQSGVLVRVPGQAQPAVLPDWRRLRCHACGARLYLDDLQTVVERIEPPTDDLWATPPRPPARRR